jgi:predicted transcriptional regulator
MGATLGERELDVMGVLWRHGPGTVVEVQERLPAELAYNTVSTILRNLEAKEFVGHRAEGRLFHYFPRVTEQAARGSALTRMVEKLFRGSPLGVVTHMVENDTLSPEELRSLHQLLESQLDRSGGRR